MLELTRGPNINLLLNLLSALIFPLKMSLMNEICDISEGDTTKAEKGRRLGRSGEKQSDIV
jgi:hypothetical protein